MLNRFNNNTFFTIDSFQSILKNPNLSEVQKREWMDKINEANKRVFESERSRFSKLNNCDFPSNRICPTVLEKKTIIKEEEEFIDVSFYLQQIKAVRHKEELSKVLPTRNQDSFRETMNALLVQLLNEELEIEKFILTESMSLIDKQELELEKNWIHTLIMELINYRDEKEEQVQLEKVKEENSLLFLSTKSGNYYALKDIKDIDLEYYDSFLELFNSIRYGTFKNVKAFVHNDALKELYEVKNYATRIFFHRINLTTFVILGFFVKKVDKDSYYLDFIKNRMSCLSDYKRNLQLTKEYLESQKEISSILISKLTRKKMGGGYL